MLMQRLLLATTIGLLLWLPIPLGSNRPWSLATAELLIFINALLCIFVWIAGLVQYRGRRSTLIICSLFWCVWLVWAFIPYFNLPGDVAAQWAPHRYELQQPLIESAVVTDQGMALSIDREVTLQHGIESVAYATLFITLLFLLGGSRTALRQLCWALFIAGVAQAAYGSFMVLTGIEANPVAKKTAYLGSATGSFINRNHFAGYLQLAMSAGMGLVLVYAGTSRVKNLWQRMLDGLRRTGTSGLLARIGISIIIIGLILSQSRMGNAAAFGGLIAAGIIYAVARRQRDWRRMLILLFSLLVIDLWVVGDWFGLDELVARYESTDLRTTQRASYYPTLREMAEAYAPLGSGLGTFEVAYPEFHTPAIQGRPRHAHNDYFQFLIETGWPGCLLLAFFVVATVLHCIRVIRNRRDPTYSGVAFASMMAVCCLAIHSVTDFNLQIPANAATLIALMAAGWACNARRNTRPEAKRQGTMPVP